MITPERIAFLRNGNHGPGVFELLDEIEALQAEVALLRKKRCETCGGTGTEESGVCHCGASMEGHSLYDNHMATEMTRQCEKCGGSGLSSEGGK